MQENIMRIRELREAAGLSQPQLADAMGVTQTAVSGWEAERFLPKVRQLPLLAGVLECRYDDLFAMAPYRYFTA